MNKLIYILSVVLMLGCGISEPVANPICKEENASCGETAKCNSEMQCVDCNGYAIGETGPVDLTCFLQTCVQSEDGMSAHLEPLQKEVGKGCELKDGRLGVCDEVGECVEMLK